MSSPTFLYQDSSSRTVAIPWGLDFNQRLTAAMSSSPPPLTPGISVRDFSTIRVANDNSLKLLDSRQVDGNGQLSPHVCGMAFQGWSKAEEMTKSLVVDLLQRPADSAEAQFTEDALGVWMLIFKFNLASLALVDSGTPPFMREMVPGQWKECIDMLNSRDIDALDDLERVIGVPPPSWHVRAAILGH